MDVAWGGKCEMNEKRDLNVSIWRWIKRINFLIILYIFLFFMKADEEKRNASNTTRATCVMYCWVAWCWCEQQWMELMCMKRRHENGCMWPFEGYSPILVVAVCYQRWVNSFYTYIPPSSPFICKLIENFVPTSLHTNTSKYKFYVSLFFFFSKCVFYFILKWNRCSFIGFARPNFRSWTTVQGRIFKQHRRTHSLLRSRESVSRGNFKILLFLLRSPFFRMPTDTLSSSPIMAFMPSKKLWNKCGLVCH